MQNTTKSSMHKASFLEIPELESLGLTSNEARIYAAALDRGQLTVGEIAKITGIKRGDCYNKIRDLIEKGLFEEIKEEKILRFCLTHPNNLDKFIKRNAEQVRMAREQLAGKINSITSTYNLTHHQPGVKVFEGKEGSEKMMRDSLSSETEIYSVVDPKAVDKYMSEENKRYILEREKLGIVKKIVVSDTPANRERYETRISKITRVRLAAFELPSFQTNMQIYDNKVAFHTLIPERTIGVIIEDKLIAKLLRSIFEYIWDTAKPPSPK